MLRQITKQLLSRNGMVTARCMKAQYSSFDSADEFEVPQRYEMQRDRKQHEFTRANINLIGRVASQPQEDSEGNISFKVGTKSWDKVNWHLVTTDLESRKEYIKSNVDVGDRIYMEGVLSSELENRIKSYKIKPLRVQILSKAESGSKE